MSQYERNEDIDTNKIAIVGMVGRFPGANTIDSFWQNLEGGVESITTFTDEELVASGVDEDLLCQPDYVKAGAVLSDIDLFDPAFFGYSPRDAVQMDPQHRLFLECAWEALEQAGYNPDALDTYQRRIGVYAGSSVNLYLLYHFATAANQINAERLQEFHAMMINNEKDHLATRVAYKCNLRGPAITVQTTCSTSLVAVHLACQSLLSGETDIVLAGGVTIRVPHKLGYIYRPSDILSPDGHCRAFDAEARGTVIGNGVGIVVLKRLQDALADRDHIYAVILGSAINNDGALKAGYTAPSQEGQATVIAEALAISGIDPTTVTYIETHGTGTAVGDPIEIAALSQAYKTAGSTPRSCAIGSLKTNIGHLDVAAGVASLIKTSLALKHQKIPPSLHFTRPNPLIDFDSSPFYVNDRLTEWKRGAHPRRAAVSSFGIGGTNVHMILEEAPLVSSHQPASSWQVLPLSAKTPTALQNAIANLAAYLEHHPEANLGDVAYTLQVGRKPFAYRSVLISRDTQDTLAMLHDGSTDRLLTSAPVTEKQPIVFLFPGQGSQYVQMAQGLYANLPAFREHLDNCTRLLKKIASFDVQSLLYPTNKNQAKAAAQLQLTAFSQPALFALEYSLAQQWINWNVNPQAMIGHSIGEYVAACLAGVFSLEDALKLVVARGRLMQELPAGVMLAIQLSHQDIQSLLEPGISLAAINGINACVVSGVPDGIERLEKKLVQLKVAHQRLHTSHAFHSEMMDPILERFTEVVASVSLRAPKIAYLSNVTGNWITAAEATDPTYWAKHLRSTVNFLQGIEQLQHWPSCTYLEVGPGRTLSTLVARYPSKHKKQAVIPTLRHPQDGTDDIAFLSYALGKLWLAGCEVSWERITRNQQRARVPLPTYPFERQSYWMKIEQQGKQSLKETSLIQSAASGSSEQPLYPRPGLQQTLVAPRNQDEIVLAQMWQHLFGIEAVGIHDNFFDLGGDSFRALHLINQVQKHFQVELRPHHIIEAPTIARQAALIQDLRIDEAREVKQQSPLVALKAEGSRRPLFLMHPAGGTVLCYLELARYLSPDQPLYGLQASSVHDRSEPETIEEIAASYLNAIRTVQPEGPFRLGGMSYGGNLAFEMARQLHQQGEEIELLTLFDSHPPISYQGPTPNASEFLAAFPWVLGLNLGQRQPVVTLSELQKLNEDEQLDYVFSRINDAGLFPLNMDLQQLRQYFHMWETHHHALARYNPPPASYPGTIQLFLAHEKQPEALLDLLKINLRKPLPRTGWELLTTMPLQVTEVPGNHYTMLSDPYVQTLAKKLNQCLSESEQDKTLK